MASRSFSNSFIIFLNNNGIVLIDFIARIIEPSPAVRKSPVTILNAIILCVFQNTTIMNSDSKITPKNVANTPITT